MVSKKELEKLSVEDLEGEIAAVDKEMAKLHDEKLRIHDVMEAKVLAEQAERRVSGMGEAEREALAQAIKTVPIPSEEAVGTPGAGEEE